MTQQQSAYGDGEFEAGPGEPARYTRWSEVPAGLASMTQLAEADLPRRPAGPVRAWVDGFDWRGRKDTTALYAVAESVPTAAGGRQLAAAARRRTTGRVCASCRARCQQPLLEHDGRRLCGTCRHLARLTQTQEALGRRRSELAAWAGELLADPLAIVWIEPTETSPAPSGRKRPPLAARLHVVDEHGTRQEDVLVRLAGPRTAGAPPEAVPAAEGARRLQEALHDRRRLVWGPLEAVTARLAVLGHPVGLEAQGAVPAAHSTHWAGDLPSRYAQWRSELDPATGRLRTPWPPGSADRLWWCLHQMAHTGQDNTSENTGTPPTAGPAQTHAHPAERAA